MVQDASMTQTGKAPSRNAPCPCGSGHVDESLAMARDAGEIHLQLSRCTPQVIAEVESLLAPAIERLGYA